MIRRWTLLAAVLTTAGACFPLTACAPEAAVPPADLIHLLDADSAVTLGAETRLCAGPGGKILFYRDFESPADLPEFVTLPPPLARGNRLILARRVWRRSGENRDPLATLDTAVATIDRAATQPRVNLSSLGSVDVETPLSVQLTAFPVADGGNESFAARTLVPPGAVLRFGFGIREESWTPGAGRVRFAVTLRVGSERRVLFERTLDPSRADDRRWFDGEFDLAEFSKTPITLGFETSREAGGSGHALPVWSDPVVYRSSPDRKRPNILVVSVDTLRARNLGSYGYARDTSPFFDSLAEQGSLFENAITSSVTTAPSHMSLFTGLYPMHHGIRRGLDHRRPGPATLAQRLRGAGYRTAAFTENGYLVRRRGFGAGFDQYTENRGGRRKAPGEVHLTFAQARRWIEANRSLPFFLFLHTYEVHSPYDPESPYTGLFHDDDAADAPGPAKPAIRAARDNYDREIRSVDDELRELFATLEAVGLADSSVVAVLSDHGEEFAEHGGFQHGGAVYEESLRIPLLFWGPGRVPAKRRHSAPVSLIDVAPTLLELAGLPVPDGLDGISLKAVLVDDASLPDRSLFSEAQATVRWLDPLVQESWNPPLFALRIGNSKFIVHRPAAGEARPMLRFDLAADPDERTPLPVADEQARAVLALIAPHARGALREAPPGAAGPGADASPELRERLRALGYAE